MRSSKSKIAAIMLCLMLAFGTLALAGCGGGGNADQADKGSATATQQSGDEQDNCYGDDLPAVND